MLACFYKSKKVLIYIYEKLSTFKKEKQQLIQKLIYCGADGTKTTYGDDGFEVAHLACLFADLNILKILNKFYNVDFKIPMKKGGMTPLHFAAQ